MRVHFGNNKLVITTVPITFCFDLRKAVDNSSKNEIDSIIKHDELLAEHTIKNEIDNYCPNISMKTILMNRENSKTDEPHKFVFDLSQKLDLRSPNKHVALKNLSIYYTWKNIRQQLKTQ